MKQYNDQIVKNFKNWLIGKPFFPIIIEVNLTNRCNLNCISCNAMGKSLYNPNKEIKAEHFVNFFKSLKNVKTVHITGGGEPLLYPGINEVFQSIMSTNVKGSMTTNGSLFTEKTIESMVKGKWNNIFISLDAPDAKTHDFLRGKKGTFEKVINNIQKINYYKRKYKTKIPFIVLGMVLSKYNINKIDKYIELAKQISATSIILQPLRVRNTEFGDVLTLSDDDKKEFLNNVRKFRDSAEGLDHNFDYFDNLFIEQTNNIKKTINKYCENGKDTQSYLPCYHPWFFLSVQPSGQVYPCSFQMEKDFGNIKNNGISKIWNSNKFELLRKSVYEKNLPSFCNMCCGTNMMITSDIQSKIKNEK